MGLNSDSYQWTLYCVSLCGEDGGTMGIGPMVVGLSLTRIGLIFIETLQITPPQHNQLQMRDTALIKLHCSLLLSLSLFLSFSLSLSFFFLSAQSWIVDHSQLWAQSPGTWLWTNLMELTSPMSPHTHVMKDTTSLEIGPEPVWLTEIGAVHSRCVNVSQNIMKSVKQLSFEVKV